MRKRRFYIQVFNVICVHSHEVPVHTSQIRVISWLYENHAKVKGLCISLFHVNCCRRQLVFVALSDFADVLVKSFLRHSYQHSYQRSSSVTVSIAWKRQLIDGQTFSSVSLSRSKKWLRLPKFCSTKQQHMATLKLNV